MADPRGFVPINQLWSSGPASTDADSECLYEEITGIPGPRESEGIGPTVRPLGVSESKIRRSRTGSRKREQYGGEHASARVEEQYAVRGSYGEQGPGGAFDAAAATFKLTRGRSAARYLQTTTTTTTTTHYHPGGRIPRHGVRPSRHHFGRGYFSNETQEEIQGDDEATLRELLVRYVS